MKLAVCLVLLAPLSCFGQSGWSAGFAKAMRKIEQGSIPAPDDSKEKRFKLIHADSASMNGDLVHALGNVHASYEGYELFADELDGNKQSKVFTLKGRSRLIGISETIEGEVVTFDFRSKTFSFTDGRARLAPDRLQKATTGDVYVRSGRGSGNQTDFTTSSGSVTTCDLSPAHFELKYGSNRILPGRRAELRHVELDALGHKLVSIPMLVVPLNHNSTRYLPEVGQSVDEGYFVKSRISTPLRGESYFDTRLDVMSRLGAGLGLDYHYAGGGAAGVLTGYTVTGGDKSRIFTLDHQQNFGRSSLSINSVHQRSDYLSAPSSTVWTSSASLRSPRPGGAWRLGYNRTSTDSSGFSTLSQVASVGDEGSLFGMKSRLAVSHTLSRTTGLGNPVKTEAVDVSYGLTAEARSFTADLLYRRNIPISTSTNFFTSTDVTPMLTLRSGSDRLFLGKPAQKWPFSLEASIGELINPSAIANPRVTRMNFQMDVRHSESRGSKWQIDWSGMFRQGLYSDDTAQYVLGQNANMSYLFARDSTLGVNYQYLRPFGFTPLTIDSVGRYDSFSFDLNTRPIRNVTFSAQSGYDVFQGSVGEVPWQFVWLRTRYQPGNWADLAVSAAYDTFSTSWSNLRLDSYFRLGPTRFRASARYDGIRSQFAGWNLLIEGLKTGKVTTNLLLDYDGYSKRFSSQHYQFIYDLHCVEAVFEIMDNQVGFRDGRTFGFFLRIKALPTGSGFGNSTRGNSIGGGSFGFGD